jgi:fatty acid desaturase
MRRLELPTWLVAVAIYAGWLLLTWHHRTLPIAVIVPLGAWLIAWHGSLQHEAIHRHPTAHRRANALIAGAPLALWLPYPVYEESHLSHHGCARLTDPLDDPESYYVSIDRWQGMGAGERGIHRAMSTLVGRMIIGPPVIVVRLFSAELARVRAGDRAHAFAWLVHLGTCALVVAWVTGVCGISLWTYAVAYVYPGLALTLVRSFAEHRPAQDRAHATAIVEAGWLFSLLYLNNNLHALHHQRPDLAWYLLPSRYRRARETILAANGGYRFDGYGEILRRFAIRPKDAPIAKRGVRT